MYYLKPNVIAEPLIYHWYANPHLISPATMAMKFTYSHLKIMSSYIKSPQIHEVASKHPDMIGGPFIDYPTRQVDEIKALFEKTKEIMKDFIHFAESMVTLSNLLDSHPKGMSLEPLYEKVPQILKGYIELYYDATNHPHFRLIEPLLYKSSLNTASLQSMLLSVAKEDYRPFCLSTPRIATNEVSISKPFRDKFYDHLFASRISPIEDSDWQEFMHMGLKSSGTEEANENQFLNLFCRETPINKYVGLKSDCPLRVRYFGHACLLIETHNCNILIDPVISYDYATDRPRFTYTDLPQKIDYVILTHAHYDHILLEHLLQLRYKIGTIIVPQNSIGALQDPSLKLILKDLGFKSVIALEEFEKIEFSEGYIQGLPFLGEHGDLHIQSKLSYLIHLGNKKILCAADANNLENKLYEKIHEIIGDIDTLFIGMECKGAPLSWLYQSLLLVPIEREADQSRRLNGSDFAKAKELIEIFACKQVYVYAMGKEPWLNYIMGINYTPTSLPVIESNKLIEYCKNKAIICKSLIDLEVIN